MTDSSGTPSDAERNLRMALSIGVMDPRLRAACEAVLTALAASQSELKAAKARMWENGHALERELAALRSEGERYREALRKHGTHLAGCMSFRFFEPCDCTCGLDAALSSAPPSDSVRVPRFLIVETVALCNEIVEECYENTLEDRPLLSVGIDEVREKWQAALAYAPLADAPQSEREAE